MSGGNVQKPGGARWKPVKLNDKSGAARVPVTPRVRRGNYGPRAEQFTDVIVYDSDLMKDTR